MKRRAEVVSRREALALMAAGVGAAACAPEGAREGGSGTGDGSELAPGARTGGGGDATARIWVKDPARFVRHGTNLETRLEELDGLLTPNDLFFVRNHAPTPLIDPGSYLLSVGGPGARSEVRLTLDDLRALPSQTLIAYIECAGNWRGFFQSVTGRTAAGSQWGTGAVGCAEWSGPSLADVLAVAGVRDDALEVNVIGLDDGAWERPMPLEKALDPATILALTMNGEPLPPDHGFPVRAVVPGWVGSSSVKWVGHVEVATERVWVRANTSSYVLVGEEWPAERYAPADGAPITTGSVKSALALPRPARIGAGRHRLRGFAYSPQGPVARVEWSADDGPWGEARLIGASADHPYAWSRFEFVWEATAGEHVLRTRATDASGETQPLEGVYNEKGYLLNVALAHPVEVV
ncbi:MAG: sulfite oxidase [Gemmatimonadetes bacterium]|nr:sulfite oxidase [Gemmatimonadota bacterium]